MATALHVVAIQAPGSTEWVSYHTQELEIYEKLLALHPESFELQRDTALAQKYIASDQLEAGLGQPAIEHLQAPLALDIKRAETNPNNPHAHLDATFHIIQLAYYYTHQQTLHH